MADRGRKALRRALVALGTGIVLVLLYLATRDALLEERGLTGPRRSLRGRLGMRAGPAGSDRDARLRPR